MLGDRSFSLASLRLWSALPENIRNTNDIPQFKKKLNIHLFRGVFLTWKLWFVDSIIISSFYCSYDLIFNVSLVLYVDLYINK